MSIESLTKKCLEFKQKIRDRNDIFAWEGLPLAEQSLIQLTDNLEYVIRHFGKYAISYGKECSEDAHIQIEVLRLHARTQDIQAELERRKTIL
jgi:hypothetical protein